MPNKSQNSSLVLALNPLQVKHLYTVVTARIDALLGDRNHSDLSASDQVAHIVLGQIEEKLFELTPEAV